jgi:hypothetical protein
MDEISGRLKTVDNVSEQIRKAMAVPEDILRALEASPAAQVARQLQEITRAFEASPVMKTMIETAARTRVLFDKSPVFDMMRAMQADIALTRPPALAAIEQTQQQFARMFETTDFQRMLGVTDSVRHQLEASLSGVLKQQSAILDFVKESARNAELMAAWGEIAADVAAESVPPPPPKELSDPATILAALKSTTAEQLKRLPERTKYVLAWLFVLWQFLQPYYGSYLDPYLPYLPKKQGTPVDERTVKAIRTDPMFAGRSDYRVIQGDRLQVRSGPSAKAEVLDHLRAGQIVRVVSKQRPWIEVEYEDDGENIKGWVAIRYTRHFAR